MHKIFGTKENKEYIDREGVYLIPIHNNQVGVIQTPKGYFFLGGGIEIGEGHILCIERECMCVMLIGKRKMKFRMIGILLACI